VVDKSEGVLKVYRGEAPAEVKGEASGSLLLSRPGTSPQLSLWQPFL
jgi:hypothetical protein